MNSSSLCDTIFQFMGTPAQAVAAEVPVPPSDFELVDEGESTGGERGHASLVAEGRGDANLGSEANSQATVGPIQQVEKEGMMLALVGNKLGEYNLRGVEAGMAMVEVGKKQGGKVLNAKSRRKGRVERSPYEKRPSGDKKREPGS